MNSDAKFKLKFEPGNGVIFIDFENIERSTGNKTNSVEERVRIMISVIEKLKNEMKYKFRIQIANVLIYGSGLSDYENLLYQSGFTIIPSFVTQNKNSADMQLCVGICKYLYNKEKNINTFIIMSGDQDYIPVINAIKEETKQYYVIGYKKSMSKHLEKIVSPENYAYVEDYINRPDPVPRTNNHYPTPKINNHPFKFRVIDNRQTPAPNSETKPEIETENLYKAIVKFVVTLIMNSPKKCITFDEFKEKYNYEYRNLAPMIKRNTFRDLVGKVIFIKKGYVSLVPHDVNMEELKENIAKCFNEGEEWVKGSMIGLRYMAITKQRFMFVKDILFQNKMLIGRYYNGDYEFSRGQAVPANAGVVTTSP
jgi:hypothetical protein